ncbi:MAG: ATP synthase F1 subunit delta [Mycoplasmataceae bacterium]|nr:ATP synthase F1 subunit delta [Mycoplasmataceae bacterium]
MNVILNYVDLMIEKTDKKQISYTIKNIEKFLKLIDNSDFNHFMDNKSNNKVLKKNLIDDICGKLYLREYKHIFYAIIDFNRTYYFNDILLQFRREIQKQLDHLFITISSAFNLEKVQINKIVKSLSKQFNKKVDYDLVIDKDLIGGIIINSDEFIIDKSYRTQLETMSKEMIGGNNA